jgi:hypothetical protein
LLQQRLEKEVAVSLAAAAEVAATMVLDGATGLPIIAPHAREPSTHRRESPHAVAASVPRRPRPAHPQWHRRTVKPALHRWRRRGVVVAVAVAVSGASTAEIVATTVLDGATGLPRTVPCVLERSTHLDCRLHVLSVAVTMNRHQLLHNHRRRLRLSRQSWHQLNLLRPCLRLQLGP